MYVYGGMAVILKSYFKFRIFGLQLTKIKTKNNHLQVSNGHIWSFPNAETLYLIIRYATHLLHRFQCDITFCFYFLISAPIIEIDLKIDRSVSKFQINISVHKPIGRPKLYTYRIDRWTTLDFYLLIYVEKMHFLIFKIRIIVGVGIRGHVYS